MKYALLLHTLGKRSCLSLSCLLAGLSWEEGAGGRKVGRGKRGEKTEEAEAEACGRKCGKCQKTKRRTHIRAAFHKAQLQHAAGGTDTASPLLLLLLFSPPPFPPS